MPDSNNYDRAEERFVQTSVQASNIALKEPEKNFDPDKVRVTCGGDQMTFKYKHYEFEYDYETDIVTFMDTKAVDSVDMDEIRVTNSYKTLHIHDDRYSGEVFKIEIKDFKTWDEWIITEPLIIYILIAHLDLTEKDAQNMVETMNRCVPIK